MSTHNTNQKALTIPDFIHRKNQSKISMITAYDYSFAKLVGKSQIDAILVGDSVSMVMHGHSSTLQATVPLMALHTEAVARGAPHKLILTDMPFMSYRKDLAHTVEAARVLMAAGAHALKLEGALGNLEAIQHLVESGVPVMGHLGLTPQFLHQLGGFRVQGKTQESQENLIQWARDLESAGCFAVVLECVPSALAQKITEALGVPTIGIGAGPHTDGQVLVLQDMLGMNLEFHPKFLRHFGNIGESTIHALNDFHLRTQNTSFPTLEESYL